MRKFLSILLSAALIVSAFPAGFAFAEYASSAEYSAVYAPSSDLMDYESFKEFKVTKLDADDTIEVIINGKSCFTDFSSEKEPVLDLTPYIEHTGAHTLTIKESGSMESEYTFDTVITKNSYIVGYQTDYEEFEIGDAEAIKTLDKEGMTIRENTGYAKIDTIDTDHGNSLVYGIENPSVTKSPFVANKTTASGGIYEYEFDMYIDRVDLNFRLNSRYTDTNGNVQILPMFNCIKGDLRLYNASSWTVRGNISARTWYTFRYIINYTDLTYDLYLDGVQIADGLTMNMPNFKAMNDHMRLEVEVTAGNTNFIAWDNFTYRQIIQQPYIESINNGDEPDIAAESLDVKLFGEFDSITEDYISLTRNGNPVDIASVKLNGEVLSITPAYPLSSGSEYKLLIKKGLETSDGAVTDIATAATFNTKAAEVDLANGTIGGNYQFTADVIGSENVSAFMVLLDSEGRIVSYTDGESDQSKIDISLSDDDATDAIAFAVHGGKPVGDKLYSASDVLQSAYTGSANGIGNVSYDNTDKSITLYGTYSGGVDKLLTVHLYPKSGSGSDAYYAFLTGSGGAFSQKILLPESFGGGKYIAELTGSEESGTTEFTYINEAELSEILDEVNSAESNEQMRTVISDNRYALGIDDSFDEADINLMADMIYANRVDAYTNATLSTEIASDSAAVLVSNGTALEEAIGSYSSAFESESFNGSILCASVSDKVLEKATAAVKNADYLIGRPFAQIVAECFLTAAISEAGSSKDIENSVFGEGIDVFEFLKIDSAEYERIADKQAVYSAIFEGRNSVSNVQTAQQLIMSAVSEQYEYETSPHSPVNFPNVSADIPSEVTVNGISAVRVEASDSNGSIAGVSAYIDGILCDSVTEEPYVLDFSKGISGFGLHELKITAEDNDGNITEKSYTVNIIRTADVGEFVTDFEEYTAGSADAISDLANGKLSLNSGNGGYTRIESFGGEHGNVLTYGKEAGAKPTGTPFFGNNTYSSRGTYTYEFDIYFSRTDVGGSLATRYLKTDGTTGFLYFANVRNDSFVIKNGKADGASAKIIEKTWHRFKMVLDYTNLTYDFYWDGELIAEDYTFGCDDFVSMNYHTRLEMRFGELDSDEEGFVAIDNYSYAHNVQYPSVSAIYAADPEEEKLDCTSDKINILLTDGFKNMKSSYISLYRDGRELPLKSVTVSGTNNELVTIEPVYPLAPSGKYTVVLDSDLITLDGYTMDYDTTAEFETTAADFDFADAEFAYAKNHLTFSGNIINTTDSDKTVTAVMNLYDANGVYLSYASKTVTAKTAEITEFVIDSAANDSKCTAKVFFVENLSSKQSVFSNIYAMTLPKASAYAGEKTETLTLIPAYSDDSKLLSLSGATPLDAESMVIFELKQDSDAEPTALDAVIASANGAYTSELKLKTDLPGGKYIITAVSGEYTVSDSFMYINEAEASSALNAVNSASKSELDDILGLNAGRLGIDEEIFASDSESFAGYIYANKPSGGYTYKAFASAVSAASAAVLIKNGADIESVLTRYKDVLPDCTERFAGLTKNEKTAFKANIAKADLTNGDSFDIIFVKTIIFTDFKESTSWYDAKTVILGTDSDGNVINNNFELINPDTSRYKSVSDKNEVFEKMYLAKDSVNSFEDIAKLFEKAAKDVYDSEKAENSSKGTGGSGGGGGGGGSVSMAPVASPTAAVQIPVTLQPQSDISGHWAEGIITELSARGIMNGYGNGIYRPDSFITRAEFVKLMSSAFNIPAAGETDFADVSGEAWYAPYIAGAYSSGLVTGTSDETFSPESQITRQDAAVIAYRYLSGLYTLEAASESFDDSGNIADYAKDAVSGLKGALILKGNGDNTFAPDSNITRAEVASLILGVITYIQAH